MSLDKYDDDLRLYGSDILDSKGMMLEKGFIQHGNTSVFEHSCMVTKFCLFMVDKFNIKVDKRALVRGSLLHDYFLYDWHVYDKNHRLHGFTHGKRAAFNASRDFNINDIEKDMIIHHMFPLTLRFPKYREGIILTISDKVCASYEFFVNYFIIFRRLVYNKNFVLFRTNLLVVCYFMLFLLV